MPLRPKTFAVLQYLAAHPGDLISKQALLDAVWGDVAVSEDVVRLSIGELRVALGDDRAAARFIETVPRRGYRFTAITETAGPPLDGPPAATGVVVGRVRERAALADAFRLAAAGRRQLMFVSGEAGIGKTTLVDTAVGELLRASGPRPRVGRGHCVEQYGGGEPYLPILEAIAGLSRGADGPAVQESLERHAPDWLLRVLGLLPPGRSAAAAGTQEHTLHRLAASLDALATETPLVLVLEDVQWSDYATLDLLSVLVQRREPARLQLICTLRPADAIVRAHPVSRMKRELRRKDLCREILLGGLSPSDVASYLAARFAQPDFPDALLRLFVERSEGNPFFMVALVDHLLADGLLVQRDGRWEVQGDLEALRTAIPEGSRAVIEPQLERLGDEERHLLEAASVVGLEFPAHALAAVAGDGDPADVERVEAVCEALVRRQEILRAAGESAWPDGTAGARYAFRHALYRQVVYQRLSSSTRRRLHQGIGERMEAAFGERISEIASELAAHFERSGDVERAVRHHCEAAARAGARFAYQETRLHLEAALGLIHEQPETLPRLRQQLPLLETLGTTLFATRGYGDEGAAQAFARVQEIAERLDGAEARLQAMGGQLIVHTMRAELTTARALGEAMVVLAEQLGKPAELASAHTMLAAALFGLGEVEAARLHAERGRALFDPGAPPLPTNTGVQSSILVASACGYLGLVEQAWAMNRDALARAATLGTPFHRALATNLAAQVCMLLDDASGAHPLAEEAEQLAAAYDLAVFRLTATMVRAWCEVAQGRVRDGLPLLQDAFDEYGTTGQRFGTTSFSMILARSHLAGDDPARAAAVADAALSFAAETGERVYEPELLRLKGECLLASLLVPRPQGRDDMLRAGTGDRRRPQGPALRAPGRTQPPAARRALGARARRPPGGPVRYRGRLPGPARSAGPALPLGRRAAVARRDVACSQSPSEHCRLRSAAIH